MLKNFVKERKTHFKRDVDATDNQRHDKTNQDNVPSIIKEIIKFLPRDIVNQILERRGQKVNNLVHKNIGTKHGWRDSNSQPMVLETTTLPIELHSYPSR